MEISLKDNFKKGIASNFRIVDKQSKILILTIEALVSTETSVDL
jgi:hypothetical protein